MSTHPLTGEPMPTDDRYEVVLDGSAIEGPYVTRRAAEDAAARRNDGSHARSYERRAAVSAR